MTDRLYRLGLGLLALVCANWVAPASAQASAEASQASGDGAQGGVVEEVLVTGQQLAGPRVDLKSTTTTFDLEAIRVLQPGSIYDILETVPGVELSGGPRANGISVNIRGFSDNEDVLTIVDGAVKNFEKYRFGAVSLEPEMLRELTVSRGPASAIQGSGAIGGVIEMETKDARDFLDDGQRIGGFAKLGYADNNDELLTIGSIYGRPTDSLDLLLSYTRRDASDLELSTGDTLPFSASSPEALLAKTEWTGQIASVGLSYTRTSTEGRELFDTAAFNNGVNGQVLRETVDDTLATYIDIDPASALINTTISVAYTDTRVNEQGIDASDSLTNRIWDYEYDIWSTRLHNTADFALPGTAGLTVQTGIQAIQEERTTDITGIDGEPTDSVLSQPSGRTLNWGAYLQGELTYGGFTATAGHRWDNNSTEVLEQEAIELLAVSGTAPKIDQDAGLFNYRLEYAFDRVPVRLFHSYVEAARYPKIDEYFTQGTFSLCVRDSSDAERLATSLAADQRSTQETIDAATALSLAEVESFAAEQIAERDSLIQAAEAQLALFIEQANALNEADPVGYPEAQRDADIATARGQTDSFINAATLTAEQNITFFTDQINAGLETDIASSQARLAGIFADVGLEDPNVDLDALDIPTRTTLPEPFQTLQVCGELFQPELATNREWGIAYDKSGLLRADDTLRLKFTYFRTEVDQVLESLNSNPLDPTSQPGEEDTWGYEVESTYVFGGYRFDLTYNHSEGETRRFRIVNNPEGTNALNDTQYAFITDDRLDLPADQLALTARWISKSLRWELGFRATLQFSREALQLVDDQAVRTTQPSVSELDIYATWRPRERTDIRFTANNVTNAEFLVVGGITDDRDLVLGNFNVGRLMRLSITQYFQ
ncbi:MAG: TonB-dependent receptor plug domain-containing protein [Pseudomonadota bacterium]